MAGVDDQRVELERQQLLDDADEIDPAWLEDAGTVPTPALAYLVGDTEADFGVMISAYGQLERNVLGVVLQLGEEDGARRVVRLGEGEQRAGRRRDDGRDAEARALLALRRRRQLRRLPARHQSCYSRRWSMRKRRRTRR